MYRSAVSQFDWDPEKARINLAKHGVSFDDAELAIGHRDALWLRDEAHSVNEERFLVLCRAPTGKLLLVVTSEGGRRPRIISAWRAKKRERREFQQR